MTQTTSQRLIPVKRYEGSSCHEIGYRWIIEAPAELDIDELTQFQTAILQWADEPSPEHVTQMLDDEWFCDELELVNVELLRSVRISTQAVHRDCFGQVFIPVEQSSLFD